MMIWSRLAPRQKLLGSRRQFMHGYRRADTCPLWSWRMLSAKYLGMFYMRFDT
jgi:hypothetical protein